MTSDRPYRKALSSEKAFEIIASDVDKKWDRDVVNALFQAIK
jgi:HD-GYP domain-containing protein (c-di-GMP phosphodiesterase class II)